MEITYTFKVKSIEVAPTLGDLTDVVTRVRYDYIGVNENDIQGTFAGVTPMPVPGDENFKPLAELVEADVISWLEANADKPHMEERIEKQINEQIAPKYVETPLPWGEVEEEIVNEEEEEQVDEEVITE
jgi:hypothetical protein